MPQATPSTSTQITILNVNDEGTPRYVISHTLATRGFTVLEATDAGSALDLVRARNPELVLLDVLLPDANGFTLCEQLKAQNPFLAILLVSAYCTSDEHYTSALRSGADAYLILPADPDRLVAIVETVLRIHQLYRQQLTLERRAVEQLKSEVQRLREINDELREKLAVLQKFEDVVVGRELKVMEVQAQLHHLQQKMTVYQQQIRQEERRRLGMALHDTIGQVLALTKLQLARVRRTAQHLADADHQATLQSIVDLLTPEIEHALNTVQHHSFDLQQIEPTSGELSASLEWECYQFTQRVGMPCRRQFEAVPVDDDEARQLVVLIFREMLSNVARHAHATEVEAVLRREGGRVVLTVSDNGIGITAAQVASSAALGIRAMRERARALQGELMIHGSANGTRITLSFPFLANQ